MGNKLGSSSYGMGDAGGSHGDAVVHGVGNPNHDKNGRFAVGKGIKASSKKEVPAKALSASELSGLEARVAARRAKREGPADLPKFASNVKAVADSPSVVKFHEDRAFIGSVYENAKRTGVIPGHMSSEDFKSRLIDAHRQKLIRLTRADMVGAMPLGEVAKSEARYQGATFHFVVLEHRSKF